MTKSPIKGIELGSVRKNSLGPVLDPTNRNGHVLVQKGELLYWWDTRCNRWVHRDESSFLNYVDDVMKKEFDKSGAGDSTYAPIGSSSYYGAWNKYRNDIRGMSMHPSEWPSFNSKVRFADEELTYSDYTTNTVEYTTPTKGPTPIYDHLINTWYSEEAIKRMEWFFGSVLCNEQHKVQKMLILYGVPGSGKSSALKIYRSLFEDFQTGINLESIFKGYRFSTGQLSEGHPLYLSDETNVTGVNDVSLLNAMISKDVIDIENKGVKAYPMRFKSAICTATNTRVNLGGMDSGLARRFMVVEPKVGGWVDNYYTLMEGCRLERSHIAYRCIERFRELGPKAFDDEYPTKFMDLDNNGQQLVRELYLDIPSWESQYGHVPLYDLYPTWKSICKRNGDESRTARVHMIRALEYFFDDIDPRYDSVRGPGSGAAFGFSKTRAGGIPDDKRSNKEGENTLLNSDATVLRDRTQEGRTMLAREIGFRPAQYPRKDGQYPASSWNRVSSVLGRLDETRLHYIRPPENMLVIDLDCRDANGEKSLEACLKKVEDLGLPATYMEVSKSGNGLHLHYYITFELTDDVRLEPFLDNDEHCEVKTFTGKASLRRKVTMTNDLNIAYLPMSYIKFKSRKSDPRANMSEDRARAVIKGALNKDYAPHATKPMIDLIEKVMRDCQDARVEYDFTDMKESVIKFARSSTNKSDECLKVVDRMVFQFDPFLAPKEYRTNKIIKTYPKEEVKVTPSVPATHVYPNKDGGEPNPKYVGDVRLLVGAPHPDFGRPLLHIDTEVFPKWNCLVAKVHGTDSVQVFQNMSPADAQFLIDNFALCAFNGRGYDAHILHGMLIGLIPEDLYFLNKEIIDKGAINAGFPEAWSYIECDPYLFAYPKQGLKSHQIDLGLSHVENFIPWDTKDLSDMQKRQLMDYCINDVETLEKLFSMKQADWKAMKILSDISGLPRYKSVNSHTEQMMFGDDRDPSIHFKYVDLSEEFPGYEFHKTPSGKIESTYLGDVLGEGGYVYSKPGRYSGKIKVFDSESHHPKSAQAMEVFGKYTARYKELTDARLALKHKDFEYLRTCMGGKLVSHIEGATDQDLKDLSYALKIAINSVYGMTAAKGYTNRFTIPGNVDNIVAKRGALFMRKLQHECEQRGWNVVHIKTDSIKLVDPPEDALDFVNALASEYGYKFEVENEYDLVYLFDKAVYAARRYDGSWDLTGAAVLHPVINKTFFNKGIISIEDLKERKKVSRAHIGIERADGTVSQQGGTGMFLPVKDNGQPYPYGHLRRCNEGQGMTHISGTRGYMWANYDDVIADAEINGTDPMKQVDYSYYTKMIDKFYEKIEELYDYSESV